MKFVVVVFSIFVLFTLIFVGLRAVDKTFSDRLFTLTKRGIFGGIILKFE